MLRKMTQYVPTEMDANDVVALHGSTVFIRFKKGALDDIPKEERPDESMITDIIAIDASAEPEFVVIGLDLIIKLEEIEMLSILVMPKRK